MARLRGIREDLEMPCALAHLCLDVREGSSPRAKANLLWDLCESPKSNLLWELCVCLKNQIYSGTS